MLINDDFLFIYSLSLSLSLYCLWLIIFQVVQVWSQNCSSELHLFRDSFYLISFSFSFSFSFSSFDFFLFQMFFFWIKTRKRVIVKYVANFKPNYVRFKTALFRFMNNLYNKRQCPRQQNNQQQQLFFGRECFRENFLNGIFLMKSFLPKSSLAS
jgi:hypothetical protein